MVVISVKDSGEFGPVTEVLLDVEKTSAATKSDSCRASARDLRQPAIHTKSAFSPSSQSSCAEKPVWRILSRNSLSLALRRFSTAPGPETETPPLAGSPLAAKAPFT